MSDYFLELINQIIKFTVPIYLQNKKLNTFVLILTSYVALSLPKSQVKLIRIFEEVNIHLKKKEQNYYV